MKPWHTMLLFTMCMSISVALLNTLFPELNLVFLIVGAVVIVMVGRNVLQGDSNGTKN